MGKENKKVIDKDVVLDDVDHRIIEMLQIDGRMSIRDIANKIGYTSSIVRKRIQRMTDADVMRVVAVTDFKAAGYELMLAIGIEVENRSAEDVGMELAELDEVFSVNMTTGIHDLDIMVAARDFEELSYFLHEKFQSIEGIAKLTPAITVDVFRYESGWVGKL
ncbi:MULTISPECIES: Lrp/AsnC family transcriptional regulator [unclassified Microbulbifer]|uniref:Lrp/AsnC family transcriptional regulator n=1 Tax=Microbulbifer spongiae TaxID=2944933 RepID=A0ABY9EA91_9GAMM|nr:MULTISPECIES: Lrp/AsnC family transcriptional regulator [unclassified Microbulbifer]MDP5209255.1 Lrp/AsnC family transcriptional regulator [Microbulbifer sp. 2205BS26-8]WKD49072.1 Lrp/AsnC family transcriptional regulator [Microbulbifer sp. MI-G]